MKRDYNELARLLALKIDWPLLAEQKQTLLSVVGDLTTAPEEERAHLDGIIHLIDALEDAHREMVG